MQAWAKEVRPIEILPESIALIGSCVCISLQSVAIEFGVKTLAAQPENLGGGSPVAVGEFQGGFHIMLFHHADRVAYELAERRLADLFADGAERGPQ